MRCSQPESPGTPSSHCWLQLLLCAQALQASQVPCPLAESLALLLPSCCCAACRYSWILNSLVGAVYTFGFILMCPQLYLNYKLKSVAHLPWWVGRERSALLGSGSGCACAESCAELYAESYLSQRW